MTSETSVQTRDSLPVDTVLRLLVEQFSASPLLNGKKMRDLMNADPEAFRQAAAPVLQDVRDLRGCRSLVSLLWAGDLLIPLLSDTRLPKAIPLSIAQTISKVDPLLHVRLARFLVTSMLEGHELEESAASRLLEVLGSVADVAAIRPFLRQMLLHPNARIRSKITLLVGRGQSGFAALEGLAYDEDPRARANAVEALWSCGDSQALNIFRESLKDPNNRVVGNAVFGLYLYGELESIAAVFEMAANPNPLFRTTAAWVMGRSGHPRFLSFLARMLAGSTGQLRKTVFASIDTIKKSVQIRLESPPLNVVILDAKRESPGRLQVSVAIADASLTEAPDIKPTDIMLSCANDPVPLFSWVDQRSEALSIGLVVPHLRNNEASKIEVESAARSALLLKRRAEQWCVLRYRDDPGSDSNLAGTTNIFGKSLEGSRTAPLLQTSPAFTADTSALQSMIDSPGLRSDSGSSIFHAVSAILRAPNSSAATRHIVLVAFASSSLDDAAHEELTKAAAASSVSIHAVSANADARFAALCQNSGGMYRRIQTPGTLEIELRTILLALRRHYILEFDHRASENEHPHISVSVHTASASGVSNDVTV